MKKYLPVFLFFALPFFTEAQTTLYGPAPDPALQVSQYIRRMFEDKRGNLWFGTNGDGVCRYNASAVEGTSGKTLNYLGPQQGFKARAVRGIIEDKSDNIWFATDGGVIRYDVSHAKHACNTNSCRHNLQLAEDLKEHNAELARSFTCFTTKDGLSHNQVWSICRDKTGNLWFGTEGGVCRYNALTKTITPFEIPVPDLANFPDAYPAPKLINCIYEDKAGRLWFCSNGGGVYYYDGKTLTNLSEKDGLCNNFVQSVLEDKKGNLWFATRFGGLSRYTNGRFTTFTFNFEVREGLSKNFIWSLLEDNSNSPYKGHLWIATAGGGLYRYDGRPSAGGLISETGGFTHYGEKEGLPNKFIQSLLIDKKGTLWIGSSGGLFRFHGPANSKGDTETERFINVTKKGPWE